MKKGISLNLRLIFAISFAVGVLATAWVIIMINIMNYLTDAILTETMPPLARTAALSVEANLHDLADKIFLIRDNVALSSGVSAREQRQKILETAASGVEFVWLGFYNENGKLESGTYRSPPDIRGNLFFSIMRNTNNLVVDDVHVGSSGRLEIVIATPVPMAHGKPSYLVGSYEYDILNDILGNINISSGSTAYIINKDGKFMAHRNTDLVRFEDSIFAYDSPNPGADDIFSVISNGEIGSARLGYGGDERFFSFAPIHGTRWSLIIEVPRSDYMTTIRQGIYIIILSTIILLTGFTVFFSYMIRRIIINPIQIITRNTWQLNRGVFGHEFSEKMIKRTDEIGRLTDAFISMSGAIEKVIGEIELMTYAAATGRLGQRLQLSSHEGSFRKIIAGFNSALDFICSHLDAIPVALALFNEKQEMLFCNHAMNDFILLHDLEYHGTLLLEQIVGGGGILSENENTLNPEVTAIFNPAITTPQPYTTDIAMLGHEGGENFSLTVQRAGMYSRGANSVCVILLLTDVTMLTRARIDAEAASHAKSDFLSRMSHEIRTPMNAITGMTQIAKTSNDMDKIKGCLEQVENSSNHLLGVINDILDFSKIESGKLALDIAEFSLSENLDFVVSMMLSRAKQRNIAIRLNAINIVNDGISTDSLRLNQVLINLLSNAVKFSPDGSEVLLNVREISSGSPPVSQQDNRNAAQSQTQQFSVFRFEVVDHGIGISEYQALKLFRPFEQADGGITRTYGGTGLGLVISKSLVEMMGGEIKLESKEGEGSTFAFTIRCAARPVIDKPDSEKAGAGDRTEYNFSGKRCLLVDDVEINREIIIELVSGTGLVIETAENGKMAVEKFREHEDGYFDVILMDMQMPVMDGCTATREIRDTEVLRKSGEKQGGGAGGEIPIIAMTANVMQEDVQKAVDSGMNAHLGKPIELEKMLEMLSRFFSGDNALPID